jgi:hypothetical protein
LLAISKAMNGIDHQVKAMDRIMLPYFGKYSGDVENEMDFW